MTTLPMSLIMAIAIGVRLLLALLTGSLSHPETFEYDVIANNLLEGKGYLFEMSMDHGAVLKAWSYCPPLYVWWSAAIYRLFGEVPGRLLVSQWLFALLLCLVVRASARRLMTDTAARWAALIVALHPGLTYYSAVKLHPLPLDALLISA